MNTVVGVTVAKLYWKPCELACYPPPTAFDAEVTNKKRYRVVHYDWKSAQQCSHWRAYVYPGGNYTNGDVAYDTKEEAQSACQNHADTKEV